MKKMKKKHPYKGEISILLSVFATSIALAFSEDISMAIHTNNITTSIFRMDKGEEIANIVEKTFNECEAFQEELELNVYSLFPSNEFVASLSSYFEEYGEYYSTEQIKRLQKGLEEIENYRLEKSYAEVLYYAITGEREITNGLTYAYVESIIYNYCRKYRANMNLNGNYEMLVAYLPKEEVASYIIKNNTKGLCQSLKECYCLESTEELEELFTLYNECIKIGIEPKKDWEKKQFIKEKITKIEDALLVSKLEGDSAFKETFGGQIALEHLNGNEDSFSYIYKETGKTDNASITGEYYHNLTVNDISLNSKTTYQTAIHIQAINVLSLEEVDPLFFYRLSFLLDSEDYSPYPNIMISNLINKYPDYFQSIEEVEEFIVALYGSNPETIDKYLQMLEHKWKNAPISMELNAEVKAFEEYVYKGIRVHYIDNTTGKSDDDYLYSDRKINNLSMIAKEDEEAQNYEVTDMDYLWENGVSVNSLLAFINNMKDYLNENGEDFSYVATNPYTNRDVGTLEKELAPSNEIYVYSKALGPQIVCKDGLYITFVSILPNYEKGTLCYQTENIFGQEMKKEIPFLVSENEDGLIAIISVSEESPSIPSRFINYYFKTTYDHINKEGKMVFKLTNEEN